MLILKDWSVIGIETKPLLRIGLMPQEDVFCILSHLFPENIIDFCWLIMWLTTSDTPRTRYSCDLIAVLQLKPIWRPPVKLGQNTTKYQFWMVFKMISNIRFTKNKNEENLFIKNTLTSPWKEHHRKPK